MASPYFGTLPFNDWRLSSPLLKPWLGYCAPAADSAMSADGEPEKAKIKPLVRRANFEQTVATRSQHDRGFRV